MSGKAREDSLEKLILEDHAGVGELSRWECVQCQLYEIYPHSHRQDYFPQPNPLPLTAFQITLLCSKTQNHFLRELGGLKYGLHAIGEGA